MAEAENKRQRRTPQERANELDEKITKINQSINELEEKKKTSCRKSTMRRSPQQRNASNLWRQKSRRSLLPRLPESPVRRKKQKIQEIVKLAMKNGMSVEEIAGQLHVEVES